MMLVGIDFGTSTSEIGFINKKGEIEVIPNKLGQLVTPSVVYINENHEFVIGTAAEEMLLLEPENTVVEVKRLLGSNTLLTIRGKVIPL